MCLFNFRELSGNNIECDKSYYVENRLFRDDLFFKIKRYHQTYKRRNENNEQKEKLLLQQSVQLPGY